MKNFIIVLVSLIIFSCSPFINKETRKKKRCNRKLSKVVDKCPNLLKKEIIIDTVEIIIPETRIDSFIVLEKDTNEIDSLVNLIRSKKVRKVIKKYIKEYVPFKDTVIHISDDYTVYFYSDKGKITYSIRKAKKTVKLENKVEVNKVSKIELTVWEKIMNFLNKFWWWIVLATMFVLIIKFLKKTFL